MTAFREEVIGDARLILADCREVLPLVAPVDAIVCDPPYGIGEARGKNASRGKMAEARDYGVEAWDDAPLDDAVIAEWRRLSRWQIIFGGNYYSMPPSSCWLVWDKQNGANDFADCELAWTNLPKAVRRLQWLWNGMIRKGGEERGFHPTQKPVGVMEWCIHHLPADVGTVCDPTMGSGTTGVACVKMGKRFIGIEREPRYFDAACLRIEQAQRQNTLALEAPAEPAEQYEVRYLPFGEDATADESVQPLSGHHGAHARLAVKL